MGYGHRNRERDMRPCRGCDAKVYWKDPYCEQCKGAPERHCFNCNGMSKTAGAECHNCGAALGRLQFGFDRLSEYVSWNRRSENQRTSGWSDTENTAAPIFEAFGWTWESERGGVIETREAKRKVKAPGSAWPSLSKLDGTLTAAYTRWIRGAANEVNWKACFACGKPFKYGDAKPRYGYTDGLRDRIVARGPGKYGTDVTQKAHRDCPLTEDEQAAKVSALYTQAA